MTDMIENKLRTMHEANQPDFVFADQLEQDLRRLHESTLSVKQSIPRDSQVLRRMAPIAASLIIAFGLFATVPPLRSFAQMLIENLFPTTAEDQITIRYNDLATPQEFLTLETFQAAVPYSVVLPTTLPAGPIDEAYIYYPSRNVTTQQYVTSTGLTFWVSQQPIVDAQSNGLLAFSFDLTLPEDIEVREVTLGDTQAELVRGMWVENGEADANGNPLYRWSSNFWYFSLRWQDNDFVYEVALMPSSGMRADEAETALIDIARGLVLDQ